MRKFNNIDNYNNYYDIFKLSWQSVSTFHIAAGEIFSNAQILKHYVWIFFVHMGAKFVRQNKNGISVLRFGALQIFWDQSWS